MQSNKPMKSLGEIWNGKTDLLPTVERTKAKRDIDMIVDTTVCEDDMACGGRDKLDAHLRGTKHIERPCGQCAVRQLCLIGSGR